MQQLLTKILNKLPPEMAHTAAIKLLRMFPVQNMASGIDLGLLAQDLMGLHFVHPLGLAAGFDKHAEAFAKLGQLGFSFVEIGSVTPCPQPGNPKPRLFRLVEQQAIINRYGFNSKGMKYVAQQLQQQHKTVVTGINLGKNKDSVDPHEDFLIGAKKLIKYADYLVVNVSSPNTPGLRDLQDALQLAPLIDGIKNIIQQSRRHIPLLIKLSSDMTRDQEAGLVEFLVNKAVDGIIFSNTSVSREGVENNVYSKEIGGLSGLPIKNRSMEMLKRVYAITKGRVVLIGCGGISSGKDAYERLRAGADLLQLYTSFIYQGPTVIRKILIELKQLLEQDGVKNIREIIGSA